MTTYTTKTREFGEITFSAPAASDTDTGYVFVDTNGQPGTLGKQICDGGDFRGSTIRATHETLKSAAQKWLRQRRDWMRKEGF